MTALCWAFLGGSALAQWTEQTIPLRPGWNAVHLQVSPETAVCDEVFASMPVESVWLWNHRFNPVQFIQDPATLTPTNANWLIYFPPQHPTAGRTTLFRLLGGKCYLIKLADTATAVNWVVRGRPELNPVTWTADSFNLVGFTLDLQFPPTYRGFFGPSAAHASGSYYRLRTDGYWEQVPLPGTTRMTNGQAIWLRSQGDSTYQGPIHVKLEQSTGLDFGRVLNEQFITIRNAGTNTKSLVVRLLPSAAPPAGSQHPPLAGAVPLSYWYSSDTVPGVWTNLTSDLVRSGMAPGAEWRLRLAVRRKEMTAPASSSNGLEPLYQSLLEVTEVAGSSRYTVPVSALGMRNSAVSAGRLAGPRIRLMGEGEDSLTHAGLWVGSAVINKVNQPALAGNSNTPLPTTSEFQFPLLVHMDASGQARLLQKALLMWKDGTYKPDPVDPTKRIVDVPGRFVLLTDESLAPSFTGATLRDGVPVGRRFSTAAFSFREPLSMTDTGVFGDEASALTCTVVLDYRDPLNPFVHRYHPDHDNLNESYEATPLPAGLESFTITRQIQLEFTATDPELLQLAGWGSSQLGGIYRETITGLHKSALHLEGIFRLHHASDVTLLNDGIAQ